MAGGKALGGKGKVAVHGQTDDIIAVCYALEDPGIATGVADQKARCILGDDPRSFADGGPESLIFFEIALPDYQIEASQIRVRLNDADVEGFGVDAIEVAHALAELGKPRVLRADPDLRQKQRDVMAEAREPLDEIGGHQGVEAGVQVRVMARDTGFHEGSSLYSNALAVQRRR
ncbi:hypothetical protein [Pararhodobacter zhoushanensis]|uniref:hypothetical protein n=1 Tax=Pararhodobacter zhoushanensis TaxID=2479545 RepID=UPI000F8CDFE2|nr:hypothetical protein [Pararhodobacter zhoushanensis]